MKQGSNTPIYSLVMMQLQARPAFKSQQTGFALTERS